MTRREVIDSWIGKEVGQPTRDRYGVYCIGGEPMMSVTTIIDQAGSESNSAAAQRMILATRAVELTMAAKAKETVTEWVRSDDPGFGPLFTLQDVSPVALLGDRDYLAQYPLSQLRKAADRGTLVHHASVVHLGGLPVVATDAEEWCKQTIVEMGLSCHVDEAYPYVRSLWAFLDHRQPESFAPEVVVFDPVLKYAGRRDDIWRLHRIVYTVDLKTSATVAREHLMQVAAYHYAPLAIDSNGIVCRNPRVNKAAIIKISPDHVMFRPVSNLAECRLAFIAACKLARFKRWGNLPDKNHPLSVGKREMSELCETA